MKTGPTLPSSGSDVDCSATGELEKQLRGERLHLGGPEMESFIGSKLEEFSIMTVQRLTATRAVKILMECKINEDTDRRRES